MQIGPLLAGAPPPRSCSLLSPLALAVAELQPGQCRLIEDDGANDVRYIASKVLRAAQRLKFKVHTRKVSGRGVMVYRVS